MTQSTTYLLAALFVILSVIQYAGAFSSPARIPKATAMKPIIVLNNAARSSDSDISAQDTSFGNQEDSYRNEMVRIAYERSLARMNDMDVFASRDQDNSNP